MCAAGGRADDTVGSQHLEREGQREARSTRVAAGLLVRAILPARSARADPFAQSEGPPSVARRA